MICKYKVVYSINQICVRKFIREPIICQFILYLYNSYFFKAIDKYRGQLQIVFLSHTHNLVGYEISKSFSIGFTYTAVGRV